MKNILNTIGHELRFKDIVRAENCWLFDISGDKYLDLESGIWCTPLGHCHPKIAEIIAEGAKKIMHTGYCYLNPVLDETAGKILKITGFNRGKCVFLCSGSEAVEFSLKMTQRFYDRPFFLTMKNSYLSAYGLAGDRPKDKWVQMDLIDGQGADQIDYNDVSSFIFEPGSSSGMVHFPPKDLIVEIIEKIRAAGGIVIANEVTTGIGRTGEWFGYNHYGIAPDLVVMGKGLGNGYPVSCVAVSENFLNRFDIDQFHYSQSHQNDPLGAAVAGKVIDLIEEESLLERCRMLGKKIKNSLENIKNLYGKIKEVRSRGLMIAVEFEKGKRSYAGAVNDMLLKDHIILVRRPGLEVLRMDPALTILEEDVGYFLECFERAVSAL